MQNKNRITDSQNAPLLQLIQAGPQKALFRACRDCVAMAGVLFFAVLTTLIIGL
jgi:hypothetical protein